MLHLAVPSEFKEMSTLSSCAVIFRYSGFLNIQLSGVILLIVSYSSCFEHIIVPSLAALASQSVVAFSTKLSKFITMLFTLVQPLKISL